MNELKKGDRCNTPWGIVEIIRTIKPRLHLCQMDDSDIMEIYEAHLTIIPTHAERMQKVIDTAFDAENRLEDGETVQITVGELAAFVRHYCKLHDELQSAINSDRHLAGQIIEAAQLSENILKGDA